MEPTIDLSQIFNFKKIESYKSSGYSDPENFKKFCFLCNRTFQIYQIFALQSKKEPSNIESSSINLKWQQVVENIRNEIMTYN